MVGNIFDKLTEKDLEIVCVDTIADINTFEHDMLKSLIKDMKDNGYFKTHDELTIEQDGRICGSNLDIDILLEEIVSAKDRFSRLVEDVKDKSIGRRRKK